MMRIVLLLLSSAALLASAAPAPDAVTCSGDSTPAAAAALAVSHINQHHHHGYKFRLKSIQEMNNKQVDGGCDIELQLELDETTCHTVNPKHFTECSVRERSVGAVIANCTVQMTVRDSAAEVIEHKCLTRRALSPGELARMCPDCPILVPLNNPKGVEGVMEAVKKINDDGENSHIYALQEVGRQLLGSVMGSMRYYPEFAIVQTRCRNGTRIAPEACKPLCPDRARHALCRATVSFFDGVQSVNCEYYPALNTTALGPGEQEPVCAPVHVGDRGPPPHAGGPPPKGAGVRPPPPPGVGPPPGHPGGHPRPPPGVGPPPGHPGGHPRPPPGVGPPPGHPGGHHRAPPHVFFESVNHCPGFLTARDPAIHPLCPWPHPHQ